MIKDRAVPDSGTILDNIAKHANERQVAGDHYQSKIQHWDYVVANDLDYFQAQITKYITRWKKKNGFQDLLKAQHFLEKYIELNTPKPKPKEPLKDDCDLNLAQAIIDKQRYSPDYQETLSKHMAKMREDAMTGIPEYIRNAFWDGYGPQAHGYVNQDGPND